MQGGLSPLPIDVLWHKHARQNLTININLAQQLLGRLGLAAAEAGRWTKNGVMFDVSLWQALADKTTSSVRWDLLHHPKFHGGYYKWGEAWGTGAPQSDISQRWLDPTRLSNRRKMLKEGLLSVGYIYHNTAWARDLAWTEGSMKDLFVGTIDQVANKLIHNDPNIYLLCTMLKDSTGQTFSASQLRSDPDAEVDGAVIDLEKHWLSNGAENGDFWNALTLDTTCRGVEFLCANGYLPQKFADTLTIYSSEWYLRAYGNVLTREVVGRYDAIAAGYYWDENKVGYLNCKTIDELLALLDTIATWWQPYNIGASKPGKVILAYQIAANITMPQVTGPTGGPSAIDVNSLNISAEALYARYPGYAKRRAIYEGKEPPVDPPPVEPPPVEVKRYWAKVRPTAQGLKLRTAPSTTADVLDEDFRPAAKFEISGAPVADGVITWASLGKAFFAVKKGNVEPYAVITEETK